MGKYDNEGRTDLWKAAIQRRDDARALLGLGGKHALAAAYLGGYAVECRLKAIAMEIYGCWTLRELVELKGVAEDVAFQHGLEGLLALMPEPLQEKMRSDRVIWKPFAGIVNRWKVSWRYQARRMPEDEASTFLDAVDTVFNWLHANRA